MGAIAADQLLSLLYFAKSSKPISFSVFLGLWVDLLQINFLHTYRGYIIRELWRSLQSSLVSRSAILRQLDQRLFCCRCCVSYRAHVGSVFKVYSGSCNCCILLLKLSFHIWFGRRRGSLLLQFNFSRFDSMIITRVEFLHLRFFIFPTTYCDGFLPGLSLA